jgi:hypothetical protein
MHKKSPMPKTEVLEKKKEKKTFGIRTPLKFPVSGWASPRAGHHQAAVGITKQQLDFTKQAQQDQRLYWADAPHANWNCAQIVGISRQGTQQLQCIQAPHDTPRL